MEEFIVWEVCSQFLNRDLGWVRHHHGLYSEYDDAVIRRDDVADSLTEDGFDFEVVVKGRKVNEKRSNNEPCSTV